MKVITDKEGIVLSTGFNGVPKGRYHCNEGHPCPDHDAASGTKLDGCFAVHAEQNALIYLQDHNRARNIYVTTFPCMHCLKMLLNTNIDKIYYREDYPGSNPEYWINTGRKMIQC